MKKLLTLVAASALATLMAGFGLVQDARLLLGGLPGRL